MPILDELIGWDATKIRTLFRSYGLTLQGWERARTDRVVVRDAPLGILGIPVGSGTL